MHKKKENKFLFSFFTISRIRENNSVTVHPILLKRYDITTNLASAFKNISCICNTAITRQQQ